MEKLYVVILLHKGIIVDVIATFSSEKADRIWEDHVAENTDPTEGRLSYQKYATSVDENLLEGHDAEGSSIYGIDLDEVKNKDENWKSEHPTSQS
jgi:hypothetical protein